MELMVTALIESVKMLADPLLMLIIFIGVIWGNIAGALPGVGPGLALGIALPFTFAMTPVQAIAFLISINVADSYGNSIPAVLIGVPGSTSTVLTAVDGYELTKKGRSGEALGVQYYSAMMGATLGIFFFLLTVVPLSGMMYVFLPPEMWALYFLGCTAVISITSDNIIKGLLSAAFGFAISLIGRDPVSAVTRFAFTWDMRPGLEVVPVVIGALAVSELFRQMRQGYKFGAETSSSRMKWEFPPLKVLWRVTPAAFMGTIIGQIIGSIPGLGGTTAAFISYNQSKLWSKHPEEYGHGSIEGIAANEAAQNAAQCGEMVPTFGLGIPGSGTMVLLFAALLMNGFVPGPALIRDAPQLLYAASTGLLASTLMLIIMGWFICGLLVKVVSFDRTMVLMCALALCMLGVYTLNRSGFDVFVMLLFGVVGYFMMRYGYSPAGFAITVVLGAGFEAMMRRGLLICHKSWWEMVSRPWTGGVLLIVLGLLIYGIIGTIRMARLAANTRRKALEAALASMSAPDKKG